MVLFVSVQWCRNYRFVMLWLLVSVVVIILGYWTLIKPYQYWKKKGVKQAHPIPIFGDNWKPFFRMKAFAENIEAIYKEFSNDRYLGIYQFSKPNFVVRDPELIKLITVKDFDHFTDHFNVLPDEPVLNKSLLALTGKTWRNMRNTLSPAFTSSKMKFMFSLISQNGEQFINYFLETNEDLITIEMKDTSTRFTSDVIANTAFGVECDSLRDRTNEFYLMGKDVTNFGSIWKVCKIFTNMISPRLYKILKVRLFSKQVTDFFSSVIQSNILSREKHGIVRPDMIHLLLEARKNRLKHDESQPSQDTGFATVQESEMIKSSANFKAEITDEDITAQALIFFFAGFDAVSYFMCFVSYELAANPEIQDRLIEEVDKTFKFCRGRITYEALLSMKYLDMVVSETLRKWPGAFMADRICTKPYIIEPKRPGEVPVHLEKGDVLMFPIFGIHRDPQYYPDPERFDPERFSDENKDKIQPYTFMPFGVGPRNCIGSRFALLETKTLFFYILAHFQIVPVEKTQIPLKLSKKQFNVTAENGFWLGLKRRVKT